MTLFLLKRSHLARALRRVAGLLGGNHAVWPERTMLPNLPDAGTRLASVAIGREFFQYAGVGYDVEVNKDDRGLLDLQKLFLQGEIWCSTQVFFQSTSEHYLWYHLRDLRVHSHCRVIASWGTLLSPFDRILHLIVSVLRLYRYTVQKRSHGGHEYTCSHCVFRRSRSVDGS